MFTRCLAMPAKIQLVVRAEAKKLNCVRIEKLNANTITSLHSSVFIL